MSHCYSYHSSDLVYDISRRCCVMLIFFFFKQKTAYEMRISDWSSDVCSSDLSFYGARISRQRTRVLVCSQRTRRYLPMLGRRAAIRGQRLLVLRQGRQTGRKIGRASCRESVCKYG